MVPSLEPDESDACSEMGFVGMMMLIGSTVALLVGAVLVVLHLWGGGQ